MLMPAYCCGLVGELPPPTLPAVAVKLALGVCQLSLMGEAGGVWSLSLSLLLLLSPPGRPAANLTVRGALVAAAVLPLANSGSRSLPTAGRAWLLTLLLVLRRSCC